MQEDELIFIAGIVGPVLLGIAVLVSQRWIAGRHRYDDDPLNLAINMAGWTLVMVGGFGTLLLLLGIPSIPFSIIAVVVAIEVVRKRRATRQYALLWVLTVSVERGMPLVPAIEAFAQERGRWGAERVRWLAVLSAEGVSLPDALARLPGLLPRHALAMVRVGCQSGALAPALRQAASIYDLQEPVWMSVLGKIGYVLVLMAFGLAIFGFMALKILPQFVRIFCEFGTPLPLMTQCLFAWMHYCLNFWYLPILLSLAILLYAAGRYLGWIQWDLPGVARLARRNDTAMILDGLAVAAGQNRPMLEAICALAESYPKRAIRRRLRKTAVEVESGGDWCEGLFHHGLIRRADRAVLLAAQRVGNLAWALREMADSNRRRLAYHAQALVQMLFPPVLLVFGAIVMFVVVGMFLPLIALIYRLS